MADRRSRADTQQGRGEIRQEPSWDQFRRWFDTPIDFLEALESLVDPSSGSVFEPKTERVARDIYHALIPTTPREIAAETVGGAVAGPVIGAGVRRAGRALFPDVPHNASRRLFGRDVSGQNTVEQAAKRREMYGEGTDHLHERSGKLDELRDATIDAEIEMLDLPDPDAFDAVLNDGLRSLPGDKGPKTVAENMWDALEQANMTERAAERVANKYTRDLRVGGSGELDPQHFRMLQDYAFSQDPLRATSKTLDLERQVRNPSWLDLLKEHGHRMGRLVREDVARETGDAVKKVAPHEAHPAVDELLRRMGVDVSRRKPK
jgi:hypothetical protein